MPALGATTTATFASVGISATEIYSVFVSLVGSAVSMGLWLIQVSWPFLLTIAFIYVMWKLASMYRGFGR